MSMQPQPQPPSDYIQSLNSSAYLHLSVYHTACLAFHHVAPHPHYVLAPEFFSINLPKCILVAATLLLIIFFVELFQRVLDNMDLHWINEQ